MKYDITKDDQDIMVRDLASDRTLKHIRNLSFYKFSIGDVLVREDKYTTYNLTSVTGAEWRTRTASDNIPYKYVYVFENELGVGYIRRLSVNGKKFVERPTCVTEFDPDQTRFSLDPEYADHMLLSSEDEEFDTKSRYAEAKKRREQIHRKNKKIAVPMPDEAAVLEWMKTLKVGDQIWWGHNIGGINKDVYYVHEIVLVEPPKAPQPVSSNPHWTSYGYSQQFVPHIKVSTQVPNSVNMPNGYNSSLYSTSLVRYYVFMQRPTFMDEVIN